MVWAIGLRNPTYFSFDPPTGDLFIVDQGRWDADEIDFVPKGDTSARNFGWKIMEGGRCWAAYPIGPRSSCDPKGLTLPAFVTPLMVIGGTLVKPSAAQFSSGVIYRGSAIPCLKGRYVFAIRGTGAFYSGVFKAGALVDMVEHVVGYDEILDIISDRDGELLAVYNVYGDGGIFKVEGRQ